MSHLGLGQRQRQGAPGCYGGAEKKGPQALGQSRGGRNTKVHVMVADDCTALTVTLSPGQAHDGVEGRKLLTQRGPQEPPAYLLMDRAYEGDATRPLAQELGYCPVVPPRRSRRVKGEYDKELYRRRNEVERFFGRLKRFRRVFTRYDQRDPRYLGFVLLACSFELLRSLF